MAPGAVLSNHPKTAYRWKRFTQGAAWLADALETGAHDYRTIPKIFDHLKHFWSQALYVRALPTYLLDLASEEETAVGVQRVLRVEAGKRVVVVSSMEE